MSRASWITLVIALLLIGGAVTLFVTMFEKKSVSRKFGYSPEARLNDLLAARRFLKRMGIDAENMATPSLASTLPPVTDTILLATKRLTVDQRTQEQLLSWTRSGGHLVLTARSETVTDGLFDLFERFNEIESDGDPFLESLGVKTIRLQSAANNNQRDESFGVAFPRSDDFIWVGFEPGLRLQLREGRFRSLSGDAEGDFVVSAELGSGRISIISDRRVLHNRRIGKHDHARFLLELIDLGGNTRKVWLIADDDMPGLYAWLWQHASQAVITIGLITLMVLLKVSRRFGPVIDIAPASRRRLIEHIQASGWFLWRHRHYGQLLTGMQNTLRHELAIRHPGISELGATAAASRLSAFTDLTPAEIQQILGSSDIENKEQFTNTVRLYERLRKQL
jgi:hypothetical protein